MNYLGLYLRNSLRKGVAEQHKWKSSSVCRKIASVLERNRQMCSCDFTCWVLAGVALVNTQIGLLCR